MSLGLAAGFGFLVALLLLSVRSNRVANRLLAALLGVRHCAWVPT